ncbi:MAG TPA: hydantoinase/oxoprolinase family protein [bacterium]|nr:hydantoinase/oxoprolinase family protein [bacterium]
MERKRDLRIAADVGGTFTDLVMVREGTGETYIAKTRTTPADPAVGLMTGVRQLLAIADAAPGDVSHLLFASTVATNAVLQLAGARIGLIVTKGFRHILEIGRANIPGRLTNELRYRRPERLVPIERIREADERCLADGTVLRALDEGAARGAIRELLAADVECIAVVLLHSYANPAHERRIRDLVAEQSAQTAVTLSSDVLPEYREYERTMTTVLNAYVMPAMARAVRGVERRLREDGLSPALAVVRSDGGLMSADAVVRQPVNTVLSGPAAGVSGAAFVARLAGYPNAISLDMGGTSTDVSLAAGGTARIRADTFIGEYPVKVPITDVVTIGAGGGSIAHLTSTGALHVGPRSAGAEPGPVCYDQGGEDVTVTDANLVLGRLPAVLAGGAVMLNVERARAAMHALAARVGIEPLALAEGILRIANEKMLGALRVVSVQRGYDPRDFVFIPFGGAGPVHSGDLCRLLGIRTAVIPPTPGVLSAVGALVSDIVCVFGRTRIQPVARLAFDEVNAAVAALGDEAQAWLDAEHIGPDARTLAFSADLRYVGQAYEVAVPVPERLAPPGLAATIEAFHAEHRRLYGFDWRGHVPVEMVALKVTGRGRVAPVRIAGGPSGDARVGDARTGARPVRFDGRFLTTPCYDRGRLARGARIPGPAIVEQLDCTSVILPGQTARVDASLNLVVEEG